MGSKSAIGIGNGICFKQVRDKGGGPYIDPLVRDSLVGVWIADQNTNESPTRNIIKNTIKDKVGDLELLNFGYKLNSGYGKYEEDFTTWGISKPGIVSTINVNSIHITRIESSLNEVHAFFENATTTNKKFNIKLKISGLTSDMKCTLNNQNSIIKELVNGVNELSVDLVTGWYGFMIIKLDGSIIGDCDITIEQIPSHQGALVTDGVDDMIASQKTMQEMLDGSNEMTVVSMIHQIAPVDKVNNLSYNNYFRNSSPSFIRNNVKNIGKTGIYGYIYTTSSTNIVTNILGDKNDYSNTVTKEKPFTSRFFVEGCALDNGTKAELSQVAWYWTFIAKRALTTDEINQVIAYYNLDRTLKPDILCNTIKQGITNENHAEFGDKLIDFSGNGRDIQLNNIAWKGDSGIGKYETDFTKWLLDLVVDITRKYSSFNIKTKNDSRVNSWVVRIQDTVIPSMKVKVTGISSSVESFIYRYSVIDDKDYYIDITSDGIYELPQTNGKSWEGFRIIGKNFNISVEQIPSYAGALCLDGVNDFGQFVGDLGLKDYTLIMNRAYNNLINNQVPLISSNIDEDQTPFIVEHWNTDSNVISFSYGASRTTDIPLDINKKIVYQSTYSYMGYVIPKGNAISTGNGITLGKFGNGAQYSAICLWSLMLFPYSMSNFLIERQLKKHKLGTLYPNMVEFRPVISGNIPYNAIEISQGSTTLYNESTNKTGIYLQEGSTVRVYIRPSGIDKVSKITINGIEYTDLPINVNGYYYADFPITKSPQKISYVIDEYIRFEDIVQPYPEIVNLSQNGKSITWGDKLKVGSDIVFVESANLLPELYTVSDTRYNGVTLYPNTIIKVEKSMVFDNARTYLKANEPNCILSPNRLRIPNSSYKILGYIPDLTGKGNHGKLNNFAYTEDSGVASDGSIKIDGTDDHITISNIIGGKCIMVKVTVNRNSGIIYDQRRANVPNKSWMQLNPSSVIFEQNAVSTYIDGILNHNVTGSDLVSKTVNLTCELEIGDTSGTYQPTIGSSYAVGYTTDINLYEFMLFPDVLDEEEIKELNDIIGIEGGYVERPEYY